MICFEFGQNLEKLYDGICCREKFEDYPIFHSHQFWEFVICKQGSFDHVINNKHQVLDVGDAVLLAPGDSHSLAAKSDKVSHLNIGISIERFEGIANAISPKFIDFLKNNTSHIVKFSLERLKKIEHYMQAILLSTNETDVSSNVSFLLFNILEPIFTSCNEMNNDMPGWFKDVIIQCNSFKHLNWKPHDVCEYANYSQAHVNRLFRKLLDTTLVDYLIDIKMKNAIILLTNSDMSLSNISNTLGYSSVSYFSHTFKSFYKVSPYKYKKNFMENLIND